MEADGEVWLVRWGWKVFEAGESLRENESVEEGNERGRNKRLSEEEGVGRLR
jgi:hypothetical protein